MPTFRNTLFHLYRQVDVPMKMEQSVPKRRHIKFRRRGITQKKTYNISEEIPASLFQGMEKERGIPMEHHNLGFKSRPMRRIFGHVCSKSSVPKAKLLIKHVKYS